MFRPFSFAIFLLSAFALISVSSSTGQTKENASSSSSAMSNDVSGKWQVSWQGRLGTEQCIVQMQQDSTNKLKGTLQDQRGIASLTGTIDGKNVTFDVQFQGPRPFTTRFTGTADGDKMEGKSQATNVGGSGAFLGHGGEVVQPEHPWTAKRIVTEPASTQSSQSIGTGSNPNTATKN
ncbi:MAG TPA: hypothetical protein VK722_16115 [Candidatus Aquilonibacter sp.]|nr:hypothetical protein [Candidatus Aquilonibacter sp.]